MKSKPQTNNKYIIKNQRVRKVAQFEDSTGNKTDTSPVFAKLAEEGHENYYNYLDWLGLAKSPDFLILTSSHHYYFENEDLKVIKTVVNLEKLNNIKGIKDFLHSIYHVLPKKCYFIGCFIDNKNYNGLFSFTKRYHDKLTKTVGKTEKNIGQWSSFLYTAYHLFDSKTNRYMTERTVRLLFANSGLKVLDITEFNGLTYFCVQKDKLSAE
jgi:hypothetical protein